MQDLVDYCVALPQVEREAFVRGVALYENTVGGLGSVTSLKRLIPLLGQAQDAEVDWILRNTRSYWYYSHGATSLAELNSLERARAHRASESLSREAEREQLAKAHKAKAATVRLYNAVRRGDVKAVRALLALGADPTVPTPDGSTLLSLALDKQRQDIAAELQVPSASPNVP